MGRITVTTAAGARALTSLEAVKLELCITHAEHDEFLRSLITQASSVWEGLGVYPREAVTEDLPAFGSTVLRLERAPLVLVSEVRWQTSALAAATYSIHSEEHAHLWRDEGWQSTEVYRAGLVRALTPAPPKQDWHVDYTAGWLVPGAEMRAATTLSAIASDSSFNDSAGNFPLLVAGDTIRASGWATAGNNGTKTIASRTATKLIVEESLADEADGQNRSLEFGNLPPLLERAVIVTVKAWYLGRKRDPNVRSEKLGAFFSAQYNAHAIPPEARALASDWVSAWA